MSSTRILISKRPGPQKLIAIFSQDRTLRSAPDGYHTYGKSQLLVGKSTINGQFPLAMLVYRRMMGIYSVNMPKSIVFTGG